MRGSFELNCWIVKAFCTLGLVVCLGFLPTIAVHRTGIAVGNALGQHKVPPTMQRPVTKPAPATGHGTPVAIHQERP